MSAQTLIVPAMTIYQTLPITGVDTIAALRLVPNADSSTWVTRGLMTVFGNAAALDGTQWLYFWDPTSTDADDGDITIKPTAVTTGRWKKIAGFGNASPSLFSGTGSPEGVLTAAIGSIYTDTTTGDLYKKISGTGNTGWA